MAETIDLETMKSQLLARADELRQLSENSAESQRAVELDQTRVGRLSRVDALQFQAMAMETERRRNLDLQRIEAALARIETDEYGYCLTCGEDIPIERLEFDPATPTCVDCASATSR
jgi:DnaK suppressor protein